MLEDTTLDTLMQRYLEGTLSEAEAQQLLDAVQSQPDLGTAMLDHLAMDTMLRELAASQQRVLEKAPAAVAAPVTMRRFSIGMLAGVAAMAACITLSVTWWWLNHRSSTIASTEATTSAVAMLTRSVNAEWADASPQPQVNALLSPGLLKLKSGAVQIEFFEGARVLLEGPAELQLVSDSEAFCAHGKLSAHVPPQAKGFKISTPKGTIVDLGTEFGLTIDDKDAQVHVFQGEVELHQGTAMQSLKQGQGAAFNEGGTPRSLPADAADFLSMDDLESRTAASLRDLRDRWLERGAVWNRDASLRLRFDFEEGDAARVLHNRALQGGGVPDGNLVGCAWTEGRWTGKRALAFRSAGDRVRLSMPGTYESLTLSAWVRVDGLDRQFNSLFMSQGWSNSATHWQITREGKVRFGVAGEGKLHSSDYDSPAAFTPERFGQWTHLALVYDGPSAQVRHYINGECVARHAMPQPHPVRPGIAELGNWNDNRRQDRIPIRNLSGAMDEFAAYARALSDDEVRALAQ